MALYALWMARQAMTLVRVRYSWGQRAYIIRVAKFRVAYRWFNLASLWVTVVLCHRRIPELIITDMPV